MKEMVHHQFFVHERHNTIEFDKYTERVADSEHKERGPFEERDEAEEEMQKRINEYLQTGPWRRSANDEQWLTRPDTISLEIRFSIEKREVSRRIAEEDDE